MWMGSCACRDGKKRARRKILPSYLDTDKVGRNMTYYKQTFGNPIKAIWPPFLYIHQKVFVTYSNINTLPTLLPPYLSKEKELFTMEEAPVASTNLPTPFPFVSLRTACIVLWLYMLAVLTEYQQPKDGAHLPASLRLVALQLMITSAPTFLAASSLESKMSQAILEIKSIATIKSCHESSSFSTHTFVAPMALAMAMAKRPTGPQPECRKKVKEVFSLQAPNLEQEHHLPLGWWHPVLGEPHHKLGKWSTKNSRNLYKLKTAHELLLTFQNGRLGVINIWPKKIGITSRNDGVFWAAAINCSLAVTKLVESLADVRGPCMKSSHFLMCTSRKAHFSPWKKPSLTLTVCALVALATVKVIFHANPFSYCIFSGYSRANRNYLLMKWTAIMRTIWY